MSVPHRTASYNSDGLRARTA